MDNKNILLGITSSIAAYKIYELIRLYKKNSYNVKVVLTENALNFVSPLVLETLTNEKVYYKQFDPRVDVEHISLVEWADVFVIAPISANTISKCAKGFADNLLTISSLWPAPPIVPSTYIPSGLIFSPSIHSFNKTGL